MGLEPTFGDWKPPVLPANDESHINFLYFNLDNEIIESVHLDYVLN